MSIMAGRALNDLENRFLTKMCLLNSSVVWVPRFTSPHYSFPLGDTRDPTILGLQLQDCMNIIHIPKSPSAVTKPESKSFVNMNWKLAFLSYIVVFTQIYLYMCPYICIHLYELSYENIFHHLIRLDSQQLPGCKNLSFFKASEGGNNSNTSLFIGNKNNFDSVFQCSKKLDKAEILCLSNSKCWWVFQKFTEGMPDYCFTSQSPVFYSFQIIDWLSCLGLKLQSCSFNITSLYAES